MVVIYAILKWVIIKNYLIYLSLDNYKYICMVQYGPSLLAAGSLLV